MTLPAMNKPERGLHQSAPILSRIAAPTPGQVRLARERAGLTQTGAALLVSTAGTRPHRTWQNYEAPVDSHSHRPISLATWELFLLLTNQHPEMALVSRT
jgi:hypothetical protein